MSEILLEDVHDGHLTLVLNRAEKRNALNAELVEALHDALDRAHAARMHSLVLRGEGKSFCAGFDFAGFEQASEGDLLWRFVRIEQLLDKLYTSPMATLAYAQGKNFGAGVDLLVCCQRRLATQDTSFRMPGLKFGLVLGTRRLAARIGADAARTVQEVAATLTATQAQQNGLLTAVIDADRLDAAVAELREASVALDPSVRATLYHVLNAYDPDRDLANLVRSVMHPGLKHRIQAYRTGA